jgi:predicted metal-dependent hydrolase
MTETIQIGEISIAVTRKDIKHAYLSVHPPNGRVTLVTPKGTQLEAARDYAVSKLSWIRDKQAKLRGQLHEAPREFVEGESHYLWGRQHLLFVVEKRAKPSVRLSHSKIMLTVRPGSSSLKREKVIHEWHKELLHEAVPPLIEKWQTQLGVAVSSYFLQRMKTRWGSCNHRSGKIRLNTELVKKPVALLESVVVHELMHLIEPSHNKHFKSLMDRHYPSWRKARKELNQLPPTVEQGPEHQGEHARSTLQCPSW